MIIQMIINMSAVRDEGSGHRDQELRISTEVEQLAASGMMACNPINGTCRSTGSQDLHMTRRRTIYPRRRLPRPAPPLATCRKVFTCQTVSALLG